MTALLLFHEESIHAGAMCSGKILVWSLGIQISLLILSEFKRINLFSTSVLPIYPLKTENRRFSDDFRGYRSETLVENGLINFCYS